MRFFGYATGGSFHSILASSHVIHFSRKSTSSYFPESSFNSSVHKRSAYGGARLVTRSAISNLSVVGGTKFFGTTVSMVKSYSLGGADFCYTNIKSSSYLFRWPFDACRTIFHPPSIHPCRTLSLFTRLLMDSGQISLHQDCTYL